MKILFIDSTNPKPYTHLTEKVEAMGGSESTLARVVHHLAKRNDVHVVQHNWSDEPLTVDNVTYGGYVAPDKYGAIVCQRNPNLLPAISKQFPGARLFLWMHDLPQLNFMQTVPMLSDTKTTIIAVSTFHKNVIEDLADYIPKDLEVDKNKLFFPSAPMKGLDETLRVFNNFQSFPQLSNVKLYVCNPGYMPDMDTSSYKNVVNLGTLTNSEVRKHMATSFAVFSCNTRFRETYGNVYAEALMEGCPFLVHDMASGIRDISRDERFFINMRDNKAIIERILEWRHYGQPIPVKPTDNQEIKNQWQKLLISRNI
jgi:glycosyltransferase involved in cell wall biosynthesis